MHEMMNSTPRRRTTLGIALCTLGAIVMLASPSRAANNLTPGFKGIDVVQIDGLIDPPNASLLLDAIHDAETDGSTALILQLDSEGVVDTDPLRLAKAIRDAEVPIIVWIGDAGAEARGGSAVVAAAAPMLSMASNATIGPIGPLRLDDNVVISPETFGSLPTHPNRVGALGAIRTKSIGAKVALASKLANSVAPVIGELIVGLDGKTIETAAGPQKLSTAEVKGAGNKARREPNQPVRFRKLSLTGQLQHTLGSPWAAYFLFALGAALLLFEFFTISVGIAGVVGAVCVAFSAFGFSHLPVRGWAVGLLILAFFGYGVDVQAGGLGPWTAIGTGSFVVGSLALYGGSSDLDPAWWIIILVCAGLVLFMLAGMTAMLRSRFSTPTVGREGMIGELGLASTDVNPDGLITLRETVWKARTNRATPLKMGESARVVAVDGLVLEVEPEAGGAKDYRDRGGPPAEP